MSEFDTEIETPGVTIPGEAGPSPSDDTPATDHDDGQRSEVEARAKAMGWVSKDEFRGPPEQWRDAEAFVRRGEEELPVLRERNRDMARRNAEMEARIARQEQESHRYRQMTAVALRQQREYLEGQYEAAKRQAVELGDTARYEQLHRDQRQAIHQFDTSIHEAAAPPQPMPGTVSPEQARADAVTQDWAVKNPWFFSDPGLQSYAAIVHQNIFRSKPGLSLEENLAEVTRTVRAQFPDKFGRGGGGVPAVEGGNGLSSGGKRSKGFSDMPAHDQRIADDFISDGIFKNRADFAKAYWSDNG